MATAAKGAHKTLLKIESAPSSGTFNTIGEVKDITGLGSAAVLEDVTSHSSNGDEEFASVGVLSHPSVTFSVILIEPDTQQDLLWSTQSGHAPANFTLTHADGTRKRAFAALVESIGEAYPVKGVMMRDISLKPTGAITRSAA